MPLGIVPLFPVAVMGGYAMVEIIRHLGIWWHTRKQIREFKREVEQWEP